MKVVLQTERMLLREFGPADAEAMVRLRSEPEIMRYTCEKPESDVEIIRQQIIDYPDYREHGYGRWAMVFEGAIIGFAGLEYLDDRNEIDVGYRLVPEHWGKGLATEASRACIAHGFEALGMDRIIALIRPQNIASVRVAEKCGMLRERITIEDGDEALVYAITPG